MGTKVLSNQRVTVLADLANAIADWDEVTLAELTGMTNVSGAVNWNSFDLNIQASQQSDDRTLTDGAGAQSRGYTNFGGTLELVNPKPDDTTSVFRLAKDLFGTPRVELAVAVRYGKLNSTAPAAGDHWNIMRLIVDAVAFGKNEVSHYYRVNLVARDDVLVNYIVPASSPASITQAVVDTSVGVGDLVFASAAYQGSDITKQATWVSSDESKLVEVHPGIFLALATGTPTIRATYPGATPPSATTITIS